MATQMDAGALRNRAVNGAVNRQRQRRILLENNTEALIDNPLAHLSPSERDDHVRAAFQRWRLPKYLEPLFMRAGIVAQNPDDYASNALTPEERKLFKMERNSTFWDESKQLKVTIFACCLGAIIQGWNQTGSNAANLNWPQDFGLNLGDDRAGVAADRADVWYYAVVNGQTQMLMHSPAAPFLSAAIFGAWLSDPLNEFLYGRRGATFIAAIFCFASVIGAACSQSTAQLLVCRLLLGIGMGSKASVIPVYGQSSAIVATNFTGSELSFPLSINADSDVAAEVSPARLRGSLVMNWQLFTAFGEVLGFSANLALANLGDLAWRLQMACSFLPTIPLMAVIFCCPESPRFLMKKGLYLKAFKSMVALRGSQIQAAKEMIYLDAQIQAAEAKLFAYPVEDVEFADDDRPTTSHSHATSMTSRDDASSMHSHESDIVDGYEDDELSEEWEPPSLPQRIRKQFRSFIKLVRSQEDDTEDPTTFQAQFKLTSYWQRVGQLFSVPRTRRACLAAFVVMIAQQLCGINILAFYSTTYFRDSDEFSRSANGGQVVPTNSLAPLWYSWGYGLTNFLFAFPAYYLIDRKGRRWLLLVTFPLMALMLLANAMSYKIPSGPAHIGVIYFWFILFTIFYSPGGGPVPFTYSSEVFPLVNREVGMSFAVFINLFGAGLLLLFVPAITTAWGETRLLGLFTGLCMLAWVLIFIFVPETTGKTLEEINYIFGVPTRKHADYQLREVLPWWLDNFILKWFTPRRERVPKPKPLYRWYQETTVQKETVVDEKGGS